MTFLLFFFLSFLIFESVLEKVQRLLNGLYVVYMFILCLPVDCLTGISHPTIAETQFEKAHKNNKATKKNTKCKNSNVLLRVSAECRMIIVQIEGGLSTIQGKQQTACMLFGGDGVPFDRLIDWGNNITHLNS